MFEGKLGRDSGKETSERGLLLLPTIVETRSLEQGKSGARVTF